MNDYGDICWSTRREGAFTSGALDASTGLFGSSQGSVVLKVSFREKQLRLVYRRRGSDREVIDQCFAEAQYDFPGGPHGLLLQALMRKSLPLVESL